MVIQHFENYNEKVVRMGMCTLNQIAVENSENQRIMIEA